MYAGLKHSHMLFITISIILFQYRFYLKRANKPLAKVLKIIPHINDTLLLITGISMAYILQIKPWEHAWLGYKIIALILYIIFGFMALKSSGNKSLFSYFIATALFIFILFTAINKIPFIIGV